MMHVKHVITVLMITLSSSCVSANDQLINVRPIRVKVIDGETKQPMKDINAFYALEAMVVKKKVLLFFPNLEPDIGSKIVFKRQAKTNKSGEVVFHIDDLQLPKNEELRKEHIFINIDVDMSKTNQVRLKKSFKDQYDYGRVKREGEVDNIDIMKHIAVRNKIERIDNFYNPNKEYKGLYLISVRSDPYDGYYDWTDEDDNFKVLWNFNSLSKEGEQVTVELEKYDQQ